MRRILGSAAGRTAIAVVDALKRWANRSSVGRDAVQSRVGMATLQLTAWPLEVVFADRRSALGNVSDGALNGWLAEEASALAIYETYRAERAVRLDLRNAMALAVLAWIRELEAVCPAPAPAPIAQPPLRRPIRARSIATILSERRA